MMKWMTIGAGGIIGGMLGWNIGHRFFGPSTTILLAFGFTMAGIYTGWRMSQEA